MSSFLPFGATNPRPAKIDNTAGVNTVNSAEPVFGNSACLLSSAFGASATARATAGFSADFSSVAAWAEFADVLGLIPAGFLVLGASWACKFAACAVCVDEACVCVPVAVSNVDKSNSGTSLTGASWPFEDSTLSDLCCSAGLVSSFGASLFASSLSSSAAFLFNSSINSSACFAVNPFLKPSTICFLVSSDAAFNAAIVSAFAFASSGLFVSAFSNSLTASSNALS